MPSFNYINSTSIEKIHFSSEEINWGNGTTSDVIKSHVENQGDQKGKKHINKLKYFILNNLYISKSVA